MASVLKTAVAAFALLACLAPASAQTDSGTVRAGEMWFEALPPQELPDGHCGLFLWARSPEPTFIFVAYDTPASAYVRTNGRDRSLRRTNFSGDRVHGHFERQTYSDDRFTLNVELTFDERRPVRDGAIVQEGVVRVVDRQGWETIMPVGGMVACKA